MRSWAGLARQHAAPASIGVVAGGLSLALYGGFITDDAAITLRYAVHLASGHGIRWNPGEDPVEGFTNMSHVLLGAAAYAMGLPALGALQLVNQAALLGLCLVVYGLTARALDSRGTGAAAAVLVGAHPALAYWSSSGLETGLYCFAVYAALWAFWERDRGRASPSVVLAAFALAALTRFDGLAVYGVAVLVIGARCLVSRSVAPLRPHLRWGVAFAVAFGAYFAWRFVYFGYPLSNSAYYKADPGNGFSLVTDFARETPALWLLLPLVAFRRLRWLALALLVLIAAYVAGFHGKKASVSYFHRFLLPVFPALVVLAVSGLQRLWSGTSRPRLARVAAAVAFCLLLASDVLHPRVGFATVRRSRDRLNTRILSRARVAEYVVAHHAPLRVVAVSDVGVIGYVLPHRIVDTFGLNDERFTHRFARNRKRYVRALMRDAPDVVVVVSNDRDRLVPHYATGGHLTGSKRFGTLYAHRATIVSPREDYHYMIFARRDLPQGEGDRTFRLLRGRGYAAMVDDAARRARALSR